MSDIKSSGRRNLPGATGASSTATRPAPSSTQSAPPSPPRASTTSRDHFVRDSKPRPQPEKPLFLRGSYWRDVGTVLRGEVKGVVGAVTGTVHAVTHPVETARGIAAAVRNPKAAAQATWDNIKRPFEQGDLEGMGMVIGGAAASVVGPKVLARAPAVALGERMTRAEVRALGQAVHVTQAEHLASIGQTGLRSSRGLYKNLTTLGRESVYMFPKEPGRVQRAMNLAGRDAAAQVSVGVDLTRLDPSLLYIRRVDGAITYRDPAGIPRSAVIMPGP